MRVGDKVMLKSDSRYYKQAPGVVGEVVQTMGRYAARVKWNQESTPGRPVEVNYPVEDLIPATKLGKLLAGVESEV